VPLRIPACWLDSRAALEGAFFAEEHARLPEYHRGVFAAAYLGEFPLTGIQLHDTMRLLFERHVECGRERVH